MFVILDHHCPPHSVFQVGDDECGIQRESIISKAFLMVRNVYSYYSCIRLGRRARLWACVVSSAMMTMTYIATGRCSSSHWTSHPVDEPLTTSSQMPRPSHAKIPYAACSITDNTHFLLSRKWESGSSIFSQVIVLGGGTTSKPSAAKFGWHFANCFFIEKL